MKKLKSKYPEKLELRYRYQAASEELILAWRTYNTLKTKSTKKNSTEEDFINLGKALEDWDIKLKNLEKLQTEINQFSNFKFYGNRNTVNPLEEIK